MLHRFIYYSTAILPQDHSEADQTVQRIVTRAQERNAEHDLCGTLLLSNGYFLQVIEGDRENISRISEIVYRDTRHKEIVVAAFIPIKERLFSKWNMSYCEMPQDSPALLRANQDELFKPENMSADDMLNVLMQSASHIDRLERLGMME